MTPERWLGLVLWLNTVLLVSSSVASEAPQIDVALKEITNALPSGWVVSKLVTNEIPYGHHWQENYAGPKGILVIAKGTRPVHAEFTAPNGQSKVVHVATESLDIWLMPGNYSNSRFAWLSVDRPIQPTAIVDHGPLKIYAKPSHILLSEQHFKELLSNTNSINWPDSPANSPELLTWQDWRARLKKALERGVAK
jgi:hypothetical protein